jgi:SUKH-3 immunity protein
MNDFSAETERVLISAGWQPGRKVDTGKWRERLGASGDVTMHEAAERFLAEFGGLTFAHGGAGVSRAREPFELNPLLALGEEERFAEWGDLIGKSLFPLGELDEGRYFLGIDEDGAVYLVADWLACFGANRDAVENLILGVQPETIYDHYPLT